LQISDHPTGQQRIRVKILIHGMAIAFVDWSADRMARIKNALLIRVFAIRAWTPPITLDNVSYRIAVRIILWPSYRYRLANSRAIWKRIYLLRQT
jgi:hypothetical protein